MAGKSFDLLEGNKIKPDEEEKVWKAPNTLFSLRWQRVFPGLIDAHDYDSGCKELEADPHRCRSLSMMLSANLSALID